MDQNRKQIRDHKRLTFVSFLLGFAAVATTIAYFITKRTNKQAYLKKWRDYDDCGI